MRTQQWGSFRSTVSSDCCVQPYDGQMKCLHFHINDSILPCAVTAFFYVGFRNHVFLLIFSWRDLVA